VKRLFQSGFWFSLIGALAALVHLMVFELLRSRILPELANLGGFLVAFGVSFVGHRRLSFQGSTTPVKTSLLRFGVTAGAGFVANELFFMLALHVLSWPVWPALITALLLAAAQTYLLSRWWAFRA
jgi:putative flippase GtrA